MAQAIKKIRAWNGLMVGDRTGDKIGFYGKAPASRPAAYTVTNWTSDKVMDCNAAADAEICDVLGSVINDLITLGLLQGTVST